MKVKVERLVAATLVLAMSIGVGLARADLVTHWKLDEARGKTVNDSSGGGSNGVLTGNPARIPGRAGGALNLDGVNDYIDVDAINVEGSFSVALWLKHNKADDDIRTVIQNKVKRIGGIRLELGSSDRIVYRQDKDKGGASTKIIGSSTILVKNVWYYVAVTHDTSTEATAIYIDGQLDKEKQEPHAATPSIKALEIGRKSNYYLKGAVDDIRIFNHALSADEVAIQYCRFFPGESRALLLLLRTIREANIMFEQKTSREVAVFLEKRISECAALRRKKQDDVRNPEESLCCHLQFMLAQAKKAAGDPIKDVIAAYEQSLPRETYRPQYTPDLLWLYGNMPTDDYIRVMKKWVRNNRVILDHIPNVVRNFKLRENWDGFERFLDAGFSEVDDSAVTSLAMIIADSLMDKQEWGDKFLEYCHGKQKLNQYLRRLLEEQAQEHVKQDRFGRAVEAYQEILNLCTSDEDKTIYRFNLAECLFNSGQYERALVELTDFQTEYQATARDLIRRAVVMKGRAHIHLGELDRASDTFLELMIAYPEANQVPEASFLVGYCKMLRGEFELATEAMHLVIKDHPESSFASKARLCLGRIKRMKE